MWKIKRIKFLGKGGSVVAVDIPTHGRMQLASFRKFQTFFTDNALRANSFAVMSTIKMHFSRKIILKKYFTWPIFQKFWFLFLNFEKIANIAPNNSEIINQAVSSSQVVCSISMKVKFDSLGFFFIIFSKIGFYKNF